MRQLTKDIIIQQPDIYYKMFRLVLCDGEDNSVLCNRREYAEPAWTDVLSARSVNIMYMHAFQAKQRTNVRTIFHKVQGIILLCIEIILPCLRLTPALTGNHPTLYQNHPTLSQAYSSSYRESSYPVSESSYPGSGLLQLFQQSG